MINEYITSNHLPRIAETIKTYVDHKINENKGYVDYKIYDLDKIHDKKHANLIVVTYDELRDMRNNHALIPGQYYRITDYVTTTSQPDTKSNGRVRPIIVLAIDNDTLSEEAMTDDGYKVWYCLDNNTSRFAWAGATKPVLYFDFTMVGDDGRSIAGAFKRDESLLIEESDITYYGYTWYGESITGEFNENTVLWYTEEFPEFVDDGVPHTFYQISDGEMVPMNLNSKFYEEEEKIGKGVIYRMIDKNGNDCPYDFKSIMFKNPNDETDDKYYYTFSRRYSNRTEDATSDYISKDKCYNNVIKPHKINDIMYIPNNIFHFIGVTTEIGCHDNTFGANCYNNIFDNGCHDNTFGANCYNNIFGSNYYNNTFGSNCHDNSFIYVNNNDSTKTATLNYIVNCDFSNEYQYNELKHLKSSNTISGPYLSNVHFCKGIKGSADEINTITIEGTLPDNIETKVAINSKGEIKIYCEADLIA